MRPLHIWLAFSLALAVVLAALGWVSVNLLRLDANEFEVQRQAVVEENVRLALWRMDSALAPLIAQESARTYFAYRSFYPAEKAYNKLFAELDFGEVLMPSDLLNPADSSQVLLHFQYDPEGVLSSPQVPSGNELDLAEGSKITTWQNIQASCLRLESLKKHVSRDQLLAALNDDPPLEPARQLAMQVIENAKLQQEGNYQQGAIAQVAQVDQTLQQAEQQPAQQYANPSPQQAANPAGPPAQQPNAPDNNYVTNPPPLQSRAAQPQANGYNGSPRGGNRAEPQYYANNNDEAGQSLRNSVEFVKRAAASRPQTTEQVKTVPVPRSKTEHVEIREGVIRPIWLGDALVLARRASAGNREFIQGCWLNWPAIQIWLKIEIADLLPEAELLPITDGAPDANARRLAALPVQLIPGEVLIGAVAWSPIRLSLAVAWVCVLLAAGAVAILLSGVVSLSERRGAFVSAVTHEMRTPLTTFRMYTEMLASDMVTDERQRQSYLQTLQTEANRLAHLVENVLAYAKIERGRTASKCEPISVGKLLDRVSSRLEERARQGQMWLVCEDSPDALGLEVRCDPAAVEQILFNLVDNACKYAASAADRTLRLTVSHQGAKVAIRVRDQGPGISDHERWRLFRPFCKSATDAAHSAPGVGLGLSLCRRLARAMHGDLRLCADDPVGACFVLTLPAA